MTVKKLIEELKKEIIPKMNDALDHAYMSHDEHDAGYYEAMAEVVEMLKKLEGNA